MTFAVAALPSQFAVKVVWVVIAPASTFVPAFPVCEKPLVPVTVQEVTFVPLQVRYACWPDCTRVGVAEMVTEAFAPHAATEQLGY